VCAVTLDALPALRARVVPLDASSLDGVFDDIARVADAIAVAERGRRLVESLRARLDRIRAAARGDPRPRVACLEWLDPLFNGGHWVPEQVSLAGGEDVLGVAGARSREVDFAELERADPDTIVLMPCGFHIDRARADRDELVRRPEWRGLRAARAGRVHAVDGAAYFSRPGPRLVDGVEVLASLLHPSATYTSRAN
jgi:iron complex transport system substrate-binding protein